MKNLLYMAPVFNSKMGVDSAPDSMSPLFSNTHRDEKVYRGIFGQVPRIGTVSKDKVDAGVNELIKATLDIEGTALFQWLERSGRERRGGDNEKDLNQTDYVTLRLLSERVYNVVSILKELKRYGLALNMKNSSVPKNQIDFSVNPTVLRDIVVTCTAASFMYDAAQNKNLMIPCPRTTLINLALQGKISGHANKRVSDTRYPLSADLYNWRILPSTSESVDVPDDFPPKWCVAGSGFSKLPTKYSLRLGYFGLTPSDIYENFLFLNGGQGAATEKFVKDYGVYFEYSGFWLQWIHVMIRNIRVQRENPPIWRPKIFPSTFNDTRMFLSVPVTHLPEMKIWLADAEYIRSGLPLSVVSRDTPCSLRALLEALRTLRGSDLNAPDILRGLPVMTSDDLLIHANETHWDSFLYETSSLSYPGGSIKPVESEPSKGVRSNARSYIKRILSRYLLTAKPRRLFPFMGSITQPSNSLYVDFSKYK